MSHSPVFVLGYREHMDTIQSGSEKGDGAPLAVCINDCQLDYGQPSSELSPICFQVRCAFAAMRWGRAAAAAFEAGVLLVDEKQPKPPHYV
jgi:hypothetical protein